VWEIILAAGWPIWPLIIASVIAFAIIVERFWALRASVVTPEQLLPEVQNWLKQGGVTRETLSRLEAHSLLGKVFASALANMNNSRDVTKEAIEETGRAVAHKLEQYPGWWSCLVHLPTAVMTWRSLRAVFLWRCITRRPVSWWRCLP